MPREYKRRRSRPQWSDEQLTMATASVTQGALVHKAATIFKIPRTTVRRYMKDAKSRQPLGPKAPVFTPEKEAEYAQHLLS